MPNDRAMAERRVRVAIGALLQQRDAVRGDRRGQHGAIRRLHVFDCDDPPQIPHDLAHMPPVIVIGDDHVPPDAVEEGSAVGPKSRRILAVGRTSQERDDATGQHCAEESLHLLGTLRKTDQRRFAAGKARLPIGLRIAARALQQIRIGEGRQVSLRELQPKRLLGA
jgi:hypothetical protein